MDYWLEGDFTALLGIGKLITSVTMTVFYLLLEYARRERYGMQGEKGVLTAFWVLAAQRLQGTVTRSWAIPVLRGSLFLRQTSKYV